MFTDALPPPARTPALAPPTTFAPLAAYGDRTVSRIRAKYENRSSQRFDAEASDAMAAEIRRVAFPRFKAGKWLEREAVVGLRDVFRETYDGAPFLLASDDQERAPTRVKPKSWAVFSNRLHAVAGADGLVRLHASCFQGTRKCVQSDVKRTSHAWTFHSQERMHERTPATVRADREIGRAILDAVGMLHVLSDLRNGLDVPDGVALPCGEGLLLGGFQEVAPEATIAERVYVDRTGWHRRRARFGPSVKTKIEKHGYAQTTSYVGVTYVGAEEMSYDQAAFRAAMGQVIDGFRPLGEAITKAFMGLGIGHQIPRADGEYEPRETLDDLVARLATTSAKRRLKSLLSDAGMRRAMGHGQAAHAPAYARASASA